MTQITHIISDLHLCQTKPSLFALFEHYMQKIAIHSNRLFVLGDLFEVWIGDDCLKIESSNTQLYRDVISLFKNYSDFHGELFFIHGNRDFLLADEFEKQTGGKILQEPYFFDLSGRKTILMHGDSLCTDDTSYQDFRSMVRNSHWQKEFLSLPMEKRIEIASGLRQQSKQAQTEKSMEIMDVNQKTVNDFITEHDVDWLIHGHTHRQAIHELTVNDKQVKRIVLSDWGKQGFYLSIDKKGINDNYFGI